jgi:hypothetical protein
MREKLNENPLAQAAVVGVLLIAAAVFLLGGMGGKGEEEEEGGGASPSAESIVATVAASEGSAVAPPPGALADAAPPPPAAVTSAFAAGDTIVLLFVRDGGIDDRRVTGAVDRLSSMARVATFVVPASRIARYAEITQGVEVNRVPALVVVSPKRVDADVPKASVHYGYQSPKSVEQAVIDAGYKGRTLPYHP